MHKKCVRKDETGKLQLKSGGLVFMPIEKFEALFKKIKPFKILDIIEENGGELVYMELFSDVVIETMYSLNTDGTNLKFLTVSPDTYEKETKRMLYEDEKTLDEFVKDEIKKTNTNIAENLGFIFEKMEEYKNKACQEE